MNAPSILAAALLVNAASAAEPDNPTAPTVFDFKSVARSSVSLSTKETASSRAITRNWETDYGSYDRDFARGKSITIDLVNLARTPVPEDTHLEVLWFSQKLAGKKPGIFHRDTRAVAIAPASRAQFTAEMPTLESSVLNLAALRERYVSGSKFLGWAVLLRTGDKVSAVRCSNPTVEALVRDPAKLSPMLEETAAAAITAAAARR